MSWTQTPSQWLGGNGNWFDGAKWSNGVPNSSAADVVIENQPGTNSLVTLSNNVTVGRLRIDTGDRVDLTGGGISIQVANNAFAGAGELLLNGVLALPSHPSGQGMDGTKTINGSGKIILGSSNVLRPEITGVTNNNATIEGAALFGRYNNASYPGTLINTGTVNANISGAAMDFNWAFGSTNTHLIQATNGGILSFEQGDINNASGQIVADGANSITQVRGFAVTGGTLEARNGGLLKINGAQLNDLTILGPATIVGIAQVDGTITNEGAMTVPGGGGIILRGGSGAVTLKSVTGAGTIVLDAPLSNGSQLIDQAATGIPQQWLFEDVMVQGRGNIGYPSALGAQDNCFVTNRGTFRADRTEERLLIDLRGFDNRDGGFLQATDGGILQLAINGALRNTGGTIEALAGGRIEAALARIEGGLIRNLGGFIPLSGMTLVNPTGPGTDPAVPLDPDGMVLQGDLTLGADGANQTATVVGDIKNSGTLRIAASGGNQTYLRLGEAAANKPYVNLTGGGQVILGTFADGTLGNSEARMLENLDVATNGQWQFDRPFRNVDNTIRGFGWIGLDPNYGYFMTLENSGSIVADVENKTLSVGFNGGTNTGFFRAANGGTLNLRATALTNDGGILEALNTPGQPSFFNFTAPAQITGGTIRNVDATANATNFDLGNATIISPNALQGPFIVENGKNLRLAGVIPNYGSIRVLSASNATAIMLGLDGMPDVSLVGGGEIILGDTGPDYGGTLAAIYETVANTTLTLEDQKLRGFGDVGLADVRQLDVNNKKVIEADQNGRELRFRNRTLTNTPPQACEVMMRAKNGGRLYLSPAQLNNANAAIVAERSTSGNSTVAFGATTITGGAVSSQAADANHPGAGRIEVHQNLTVNGGTVFTNAGQMLLAEYGGSAFNGLAGGGSSIVNTGTITKLGPTDYAVYSPLTSTGGAINVLSGILRWRAEAAITGGTLSAAANSQFNFHQAPVAFSGTNSATGFGTMDSFAVPFTFAADARLNVDLAGFGLHDSSSVTGGEINIAKDAGFHNYTSSPMVFSGGAKINFAATATGRIRNTIGIVRLQNAHLTNAGIFDIQQSPTIELNSGAVFENNGELRVYDSPTFTGDGTGVFKTGVDSKTRFYTTRTMSWPFDCAGEITSENGVQATFDKGGIFNGTARLNPVSGSPAAELRFVGAGNTFTVRGQGNQLLGSGYVTFIDTKLSFEDTDPNTAADDPVLQGSARVALHSTNTIQGVGNLRTSGGFAFEGSLAVNNTMLRSLEGSSSTWNAPNASLSLTNGAAIFNDGMFTIVSPAGSWTGTPGTRFANLDNGRLIHDVNATTNIGIPFSNSGFLEFRQGIVNFTAGYDGNGGVAVSGGTKVDLGTTPFSDPANLPKGLQASGAGSELKLTFSTGQVYNVTNPDAIKAEAGGRVTLAGAQGIQVAGPAAGVRAQGASSIQWKGGSLIGTDGSTLISESGSTLIGTDGSTVASGADLIGTDGSTLIGTDGSTLQSIGGKIISQNGSAAIANKASTMAAAGGMNGRGGALIGTDGSTLRTPGTPMVAAGGLNITQRFRAAKLTNAVARSLDELTGKQGLDALRLWAQQLNEGGTVGVIYVDATSSATVEGGGAIIAEDHGVLMGNGAFNGTGTIQSGGKLRPGTSPGIMTWNGNLTVQPGGVFEIEIAGTQVGTQYDRVNVNGQLVMHGILSIKFLDGFEASVQPNHVFDIATATNGVSTPLNGSRVYAVGTHGSFEVQIVNGNVLRLTNYQNGPVSFARWAELNGLTGANAAWDADPNNNGLVNLLEYALSLDPTAIGGTRGTNTGTVTDGPFTYLSFSFTRPTGADVPTDLIYTPELATALAPPNWSSSATDIVTHSISPGPGSLETVTVRSTRPITTGAEEFIHLKVMQTP